MTFKVNYGFQKGERDRAKLAKKEAKRREKEAASAQQSTGEAPATRETDDAMPGEENPS